MHPVLRIASAETKRHTRFFDRKVLLVALLVGLALGTTWPAVQDRGIHPEAGLFVVAADETTPLRDVLASDPAFIVEPDTGTLDLDRTDLLIRGQEVSYDPEDQRSRAALRHLEVATQRWLDDRLTEEEDQEAAFPVRINVIYQTRAVVPLAGGPAGPDAVDAPGGVDEEVPTEDTGNGSQTPADPSSPSQPTDSAGEAGAPDEAGLLDQQGDKQVGLMPDQLDPPFPLESLLLTFAYLIPLTFVSELYSGSIFGEKVRSRGILLLSAPVSGAQVLVGKSLPYVALMVVISIGVTIAIGAGPLGLAAALPIILFVLSSSLFLALVSRSQRALTFLLVSTNVAVSTFLFLPALFTQIEPVAFMSPISVIAAGIRGEAVSAGPFLFSTVPMTIAALTLIGLSASLYKAETLFTPAALTTRIVDAVHGLTSAKRHLLIAGMLAVPFAFAAEIFVLIFAVTLDLGTAFLVFLLGAALVEEVLKALPGYAEATRPQAPRWSPWTIGVLVGLGFFLAEKAALAFTVLGFGLLPRGDAALLTFGIAATPILVIAPLALHILTATISAYGAREGRLGAAAGLFTAVVVHAAYNLTVVQLNLGGGFP